MATVQTTGGAIDANDLGVTYMHEHIFIVNPELESLWPGWAGWNEDEQVEKAIGELKKLKDERGVQTILDPTVGGLGRHLKAMARAAEGSGVNVIACTGWYTYNELPFAFHIRSMEDTANILADLFVRDIEEGMEDTGIKAGVLKCVVDAQGVTPNVESVLRACARAHVRTGAPITTHTDAPSERGLDQQRIFKEEGVDLGKVVIGHTNQSNSLDYMEKLIEAGSYLGFDRCGIEGPQAPREVQLDNLAELIRRGYADRIVLSHDNMVYLDLVPMEMILGMVGGGGDFPYGYIHNGFLPGLRERGVTEEQINTMLVEAPRQYFSGGTAAAPKKDKAQEQAAG